MTEKNDTTRPPEADERGDPSQTAEDVAANQPLLKLVPADDGGGAAAPPAAARELAGAARDFHEALGRLRTAAHAVSDSQGEADLYATLARLVSDAHAVCARARIADNPLESEKSRTVLRKLADQAQRARGALGLHDRTPKHEHNVVPVLDLGLPSGLTRALGKTLDAVDAYQQDLARHAASTREAKLRPWFWAFIYRPEFASVQHMMDPDFRRAAWRIVQLLHDALSPGGRHEADLFSWLNKQLEIEARGRGGSKRWRWMDRCRAAYRAIRGVHRDDLQEVIAEQCDVLRGVLVDVDARAECLSPKQIKRALRKCRGPGYALNEFAGQLASDCKAFGLDEYSDARKAFRHYLAPDEKKSSRKKKPRTPRAGGRSSASGKS